MTADHMSIVFTMVTDLYCSINGIVLTLFNFSTEGMKKINNKLTLNSIVHDGHYIDKIKEYKTK